MEVQVTETHGVALVHPGGGVFEYSPDDARRLASDLQLAAVRAELQMEDHIAETRRRRWLPKSDQLEAPAPAPRPSAGDSEAIDLALRLQRMRDGGGR